MLHFHGLKDHKPLAADDAIAGFNVYGDDRAVHWRYEFGRFAVPSRMGHFQGRFAHRRNEAVEMEMEYAVMPGKARGLLHAAFGETDRAVVALRDRDLDHTIAQSHQIMVRAEDRDDRFLSGIAARQPQRPTGHASRGPGPRRGGRIRPITRARFE